MNQQEPGKTVINQILRGAVSAATEESTRETIFREGAVLAEEPGGVVSLYTDGSSFSGVSIGSLTNESTIHIGSASTVSVFHDFIQLPSGTIAVDLGGLVPGTSYGQMTFTGQTTIAGALNLDPVNGYQPNLGDTFNILQWTSETGSFSPVTGTNTPNGLVLRLNYQPTGLSLTTSNP
jgi:hypothetical protein